MRIFTLFAYLNDVPEGGGTTFTDLPTGPVTFQPEKGKAVLWPSVLADSPHAKDDRTHHEALPVTKGEKFGANVRSPRPLTRLQSCAHAFLARSRSSGSTNTILRGRTRKGARCRGVSVRETLSCFP